MSAPPGIEIVFIVIVGFLVLLGIAIGAGVATAIRRVFKIKLSFIEKISIAVLFLILFTISSLPVRAVGERTTVYIAFSDPYDVVWLYYGFPVIWAYKFEPLDPNARYLFRIPSIHNFLGLFVDFTFWLVVSVILVYSAKILRARNEKEAVAMNQHQKVWINRAKTLPQDIAEGVSVRHVGSRTVCYLQYSSDEGG